MIDQVLNPSRGARDLRRFPQLVLAALRLVMRAARREFIVASGLPALTGILVVVQLFILGRIASQIAAEVPTLVEVAPELIGLTALLVLVAAAVVLQGELQRVLGPKVELYATARVLDVSTGVDLIDSGNGR